MKIGILQTGRIPEELIGKHDDYNVMFEKLLGSEHFEFQTWAVLDNDIPYAATAADGWLITGSRHGVYEEHQWIAPLEQLIRAIYRYGIPLIGICFGHQIMAQALGGKVVKHDSGWVVGNVNYSKTDSQAIQSVHAFHQDQIVRLPRDAVATATSDQCQYAFLRYNKPAISYQPHPEFSDAFVADLLRYRGDILPAEVVESARNSMGNSLSSDDMAREMREFFLQNHVAKEHRRA